jgi:hypothetical protein
MQREKSVMAATLRKLTFNPMAFLAKVRGGRYPDF